jgi:uncharacterized protein YkwD
MRLALFVGAALMVALVAIASSASPVRIAQAGSNCNADTTIDSEEEAMFDLINDHRAANGVPRLVFSDTLNQAAAWKSEHMAANDYLGHNDPGFNRNFIGRLPVCGYTAQTWLAENLAAGHDTAAATFEMWQTSSIHSPIMLDPNMVAIGVARAFDAGSMYRWYWTTDLGGVADGFITSPPVSLPGETTGDTNCDGVVNPLDAALILQFGAGLVGSLLCQSNADADSNGRIDVVDAALILQLSAGLMGSLPP